MNITVFELDVSEYQLKKFNMDSKPILIDHFWKEMSIPKDYIDNKPDFKKIGSKIDRCLKKNFLGKEIALRALCSAEHKGKNIDELIDIIKELGYDRYDSKRVGDRYDNVENKHIDFFAADFKIEKNGVYFEHLLIPFYYWPLVNRKEPSKVDIAIVYDLNKLEIVEHIYEGRENEIKKDAFVFKDSNNKSAAILGIIKIN